MDEKGSVRNVIAPEAGASITIGISESTGASCASARECLRGNEVQSPSLLTTKRPNLVTCFVRCPRAALLSNALYVTTSASFCRRPIGNIIKFSNLINGMIPRGAPDRKRFSRFLCRLLRWGDSDARSISLHGRARPALYALAVFRSVVDVAAKDDKGGAEMSSSLGLVKRLSAD